MVGKVPNTLQKWFVNSSNPNGLTPVVADPAAPEGQRGVEKQS